MYPRIMVRDSEDKTPVEEETSSYLVRYMESLSLEGHCFSRTCHGVSEVLYLPNDFVSGGACKSDGRRYTKIIKPCPRSSLSVSPASKARSSKDVDKDITKHTGASSVPRPRAVLSSPDNDEIIGNLNELNRKRDATTIPKMQNHKNHTQAASKIPAKQNQLNQKGVTPSKTRPLGQNKHAQVKVSPADVRITVPRKAREIMFQGCKNTDLAEKPASVSPPKLRPTIRRRTRDMPLDGCSKNNQEEKSASDLTPNCRPTIRSKTPGIAPQVCDNNNLVEASELATPKLRPSVRRVQGGKNNNLVEASKLTMPRLRPSVKRV